MKYAHFTLLDGHLLRNIQPIHVPRLFFVYFMPRIEFAVGMTCSGCSNAVNRILKKIEGVEEVEADVANQQVFVTGSADPQTMLVALKKWGEASGKSVELVGEVAQ